MKRYLKCKSNVLSKYISIDWDIDDVIKFAVVIWSFVPIQIAFSKNNLLNNVIFDGTMLIAISIISVICFGGIEGSLIFQKSSIFSRLNKFMHIWNISNAFDSEEVSHIETNELISGEIENIRQEVT